MTDRAQSDFRFVPWRLSWRRFALVFLAFLGINYAIVRYCSKHPLLSPQSAPKALNSLETAVNDQSQEIQHLHDEIKNLRALSGEQQKTIQAMERILKVAGGKVSKLSLRLTTLRQTNDGLNRLASNEEQAIREMEKSVADVKVDLKEVRDEMAKAGFTP